MSDNTPHAPLAGLVFALALVLLIAPGCRSERSDVGEEAPTAPARSASPAEGSESASPQGEAEAEDEAASRDDASVQTPTAGSDDDDDGAAGGSASSRTAPSCERQKILHTIPEEDRDRAVHFEVRRAPDDGGVHWFYHLTERDGSGRALVTSTGERHTDVARHTMAQMLADGRPVYMATDGDDELVAVDGEPDPETFDSVWHVALDAARERYLYAARRDGRWTLVVDGELTERWHDKLLYPRFVGEDVLYTATDDGESAVWRGDRQGPTFDEVGMGTARVDADETHALYTAERDGRWHVVVDGPDGARSVADDCVKARAIGFEPATSPPRPISACKRDAGWFVLADTTSVAGPFDARPWVEMTEPSGGAGPDPMDEIAAPDAVLAGTVLEVDGQRMFSDGEGDADMLDRISRISGVQFSPDAVRVAVNFDADDRSRVALIDRTALSGRGTAFANVVVDIWSVTHHPLAPDELLGASWGHFSSDGEHFGYSFGREVVIDGEKYPQRGRLHALTNDALPVIETLDRALALGDEVLHPDIYDVLLLRVDPTSKRLRYIVVEGGKAALTEGCHEL